MLSSTCCVCACLFVSDFMQATQLVGMSKRKDNLRCDKCVRGSGRNGQLSADQCPECIVAFNDIDSWLRRTSGPGGAGR